MVFLCKLLEVVKGTGFIIWPSMVCSIDVELSGLIYDNKSHRYSI